MPASRRQTRVMAVGIVLTVLGLMLWLLAHVTSQGEHLSYGGGSAPSSVRLTVGHSYQLSLRGGVAAAQHDGATPDTLTCTYTAAGSGPRQLTIAAEQTGTKATNVIATFVSPTSGVVQLACDGLPAVYVDNADDAAFDDSGLWLVLAVISLGIGVPLLLSGVRTRTRPRSRGAIVDERVAAPQADLGHGL